MLNWTNPGAVGTKKQWESYVEKPLRVGQSKSASDEEHVKAAVSRCIRLQYLSLP